MLSLEGKQLGNYTVTRRIRSGGMGAVYEGRQRSAFDRRVAIKVILGSYASDPEMRRRFAREAKTVARLHHPHILPLIEFGDEQGVLYLVMPFIEGGTLTGYLRRHLPEVHEVSAIFLQLLDAVEYAHEAGLIHRDIKSSNVLLEARRSGPPHAYLADFGLVRTISPLDRQESQPGGRNPSTPGVSIPLDQVPGTPHYMAPEQTRGIITPASDIYALGVLLYQMLTGELPYNDSDDVEVIKQHLYAPVPNPRDADASIPAELGAVVEQAMAKRADERFATIGDFREAFLGALTGPLTAFDDLPFEDDEEEFEVYELPPRPLATEYPPKSLRVSQPLRQPQPEPIEFTAPPPPAATGQRTPTADQPVRLAAPAQGGHLRARSGKAGDDGAHSTSRARHAHSHPNTSVVENEALVPTSPRRPPATPARVHKRGRRFSIALVIGIIVPVLLILLLLLPRVFGIALLPAGFPLLGAPPVAKISLTVKTAQVRDTFLLTASPQATQEEVSAHIIPDRSATNSASGSRTVATSGKQTSGGTRARGSLLFENSGPTQVSISANFTFTASNGVQVRLDNSIVVPAHTRGANGRTTGQASAVEVGQKGNLAAETLHTTCCGGVVTVSNPGPFSGGSNANATHVVAQSDLDGVANTLTSGLDQQALQAINRQLRPGEVQAGTPNYNVSVTSNPAVGAVADQVTVTVNVSATALVYNMRAANDLARQLLTNEAMQSPGRAYGLRGSLNIATPTVEQQGNAGQLYLSVSASGLWAYQISAQAEEQWRQAIKGASLQLAQSYLTTRAGILSAHIQLPFGTDHLPTNEAQIVFVIR